MKPQILIGLTVTALYTLSGCSQNTSRINQPQVASQQIPHQNTQQQTSPQHQVAPRRQVTAQKRHVVAQRQATPRRQVTAQKRHVAAQRQAAPRRQVSPPRRQVVHRNVAPRRHVTANRLGPPEYLAQRHPQKQQRQQRQQRQVARQRYAPQRHRSAPRRKMGSGMSGISTAEVRRIGDQIFKNESGGDVNKLVHWNVGEDFAAMGIGHFTWYPSARRQSFGNTFPGLLSYLQSRGVHLPRWLEKAKRSGAPWRTRAQLLRDKKSPQVQQLQRMLYETRYLQAEYIMKRAQRAMPKLVTTAPPHLRPMVAGNLNAVANSRGGWYPLIDYVNFKGEGLRRNGGYKGQNWGLLQVLEEMNPATPGQSALNEFANAAMRVLDRRVRNSPRKRNERRWLPGWNNRISTYRQVI